METAPPHYNENRPQQKPGTNVRNAVALTLLIWQLANTLQKKTGWALLHPILVSVAAIILILLVSGIPNSVYQEGMKPLSWLMTPATVCLAVPLYEQVKVLKKNLPAIALGVLCGTLTSLLSAGVLTAFLIPIMVKLF